MIMLTKHAFFFLKTQPDQTHSQNEYYLHAEALDGGCTRRP